MSVIFASVRRSDWKRASSSLVVGLATVLVVACGGAPDEVTRADKSLFDYDETAPIELVEKNTVDRGWFLIRHVTFASPLGGDVSAVITEPTVPAPEAGVILMHGRPGRAGEMIEWGMWFACAGVAGIAIDAPFARYENRFRATDTFTPQDADEQIQVVVDLRRSIDVLAQSVDIDSDRIGYFGSSYGGMIGGLLAGVEDRIDAFALEVGIFGDVDHLTDDRGEPRGVLAELPREQADAWIAAKSPIEPGLFVGDATSPILLSNGLQDQFVPVEEAEKLHEAAGHEHEVNWYDADHDLTPEALDYEMSWLSDHLGIDSHITEECLPSAN